MKRFLKSIVFILFIAAIVFLFPEEESLRVRDSKLNKEIYRDYDNENIFGEVLSEDIKEEVTSDQIAEYENQENEILETVRIRRVIDGDTIATENGQIIRLIGVDTPEKYERFGKEASEKTKELTEGKEVNLEFDKGLKDKYGRILAYVYIEDVFVNYELLEEGFGYLMIIPPNNRYQEEFKKAYQEAKNKKVGLWRR